MNGRAQIDPDDVALCPAVSVIIPCYNAEKYIKRTLESVFSQTGVSYEVILVDDGCSDGSIGIVREHFGDVKIFAHENNANKGYAASVNLAISKANGLYYAFLDADDVWLVETYLFEQVKSIESDSKAVLSMCNGYAVDENDRVAWKWNDDGLFDGFDKRRILQNCFMLTGATVVRRSAMDIVGPFNESLQSADHDMWIRLSEIGDFAYSAKPMFGYRQHPGQISSRRRQWEDGFDILRGVEARGYYTSAEIRMRRAVLHYRLALHDRFCGAYLSMIGHGMLSVIHDPLRSLAMMKGFALGLFSKTAWRRLGALFR